MPLAAVQLAAQAAGAVAGPAGSIARSVAVLLAMVVVGSLGRWLRPPAIPPETVGLTGGPR